MQAQNWRLIQIEDSVELDWKGMFCIINDWISLEYNWILIGLNGENIRPMLNSTEL